MQHGYSHIRIFPVDFNPQKAAQALDTSRVMIGVWEVASCMAGAIYRVGLHKSNSHLFQPGNIQHPWTTWALTSKHNFIWLYRFGKAMSDEFIFRNKGTREHSSLMCIEAAWSIFKANEDKIIGNRLPITAFPNLTDWIELNPIIAYRKLLCEKVWNEKSHWDNRDKPFWFRPREAFSTGPTERSIQLSQLKNKADEERLLLPAFQEIKDQLKI